MATIKPHTITRTGAERLRQVADAIELHPEKFEYGSYFGNPGGGDVSVIDADVLLDFTNCGTTGCIAGWAASFAAQTMPDRYICNDPENPFRDTWEGDLNANDIAKDWLQLGSREEAKWSTDTPDYALFMGEAVSAIEEFGYVDSVDALEQATAIEAAKACRMIADGDHPLFSVIDDA